MNGKEQGWQLLTEIFLQQLGRLTPTEKVSALKQDSAPRGMEEYTITAYEAERNARIARNRQRMMELNIPDVSRLPEWSWLAYPGCKLLGTIRQQELWYSAADVLN